MLGVHRDQKTEYIFVSKSNFAAKYEQSVENNFKIAFHSQG